MSFSLGYGIICLDGLAGINYHNSNFCFRGLLKLFFVVIVVHMYLKGKKDYSFEKVNFLTEKSNEFSCLIQKYSRKITLYHNVS